MLASLVVPAGRFRDAIEEKGARHGLAYPWWIALSSSAGQVAFAIAAGIQRDLLPSPHTATLAIAVIIVPHVVQYVIRPWVPWWLISAFVISGVAWLLAGSAEPSLGIDITAGVLAVLVAATTATDGSGPGLVVCAVSMVAVVATSEADTAMVLYLLEVLTGYAVGAMLRWQMRALSAERAARAGERDHAALAERQRIAREIHDLVGHSLSITLLHVTGARRALSEDQDVAEALDALGDAERIGRQAMADIRRTVGVLATEPTGAHPLPSASDVDDLVDDVRAAGVRVAYRTTGDRETLSPTVGLGIYRVVQESLANAVRHAPSTQIHVRLDVDGDQARLEVRNRLPTGSGPRDGGTGLSGMASRAEQLGGSCVAGPDGPDWVVALAVPVTPPATQPVDRAASDTAPRSMP